VVDAAHAPEDEGWVPAQVLRGLRLQGLAMRWPDPWIAVPLAGGGRLELWRDMARSVEAIRRVSPRDAERWPAFCKRMARLARFLAALYAAPPPDPLSLGFALRARRLGRQGLQDLLRILPMPVAELLDDWFESDALKGALGAVGVLHFLQGPRSGGTAFRLLHHHVGCPTGVFRPGRSNILELLRKLPRVELQQTEVAGISVRAGAVTGVALKDGRSVEASLVVSSADPRRSLLEFVEPGWLDPELARALRHVRRRGVASRLRLQLDRSPGFAALALAPSLDYLERAYDDAKYGDFSRRPYLDIIIPSTLDPSMAPPGKHVMSIFVQYAPYHLKHGTWPQRREALGDTVIDTLSEYAPNFKNIILHRQVVTPWDLEQEFGLTEGNIFQGELTLDQLFFLRPVPGWAKYRTPIKNLYMCGACTHPGGGVMAASGRLAALEILKDWKRI
ncbi:MAG: phytoene desaturase family protein, partial [Burkholderiales bacterium]